ncbi:DUF418 domain-containing protein [Streptomyces clavuligerus]|uniref:Predicted membrane protein n=1 Tax=Streptomyces clavuligerus TaxID=1901 RepID=E2Q5T6_STRCL|nr:DUF418 domain-containing protein [Streptomyces clavuligerus]ANW21714.1 hypothetical protein BB341_27615 [Streptomyces clavuligerus]AXU16343.1 DUF418 domain-containing protein [Streptomyces clavuligerus]EFG05096.1 Predicted membrane protein [Streptomyces clavuligerus]MBY6306505.1 DUF418 domain-containing protein [Streptomyces clavuligerus]QCS09123.1 DUF418 domain-containing protein [Streptomyces clavuligerus]
MTDTAKARSAAEGPEEPGTTETAPREIRRIADVDALRGFALLGILLVNLTVTSTAYIGGGGLTDPAFDGPLHDAWRYLIAVLLETKFYLLFSFLFGYSFTLQMRSAERAGARIAPRVLRRCAALLAIGAVHAVALYTGDILITYSVLGLLLLACRNLRPRTAVRVAVTIFAVLASLYLALSWTVWAGHLDIDVEADPAEARATLEALRGDVGSVLGENLSEQPIAALFILFVQGPPAFAAFLLGLAAGKLGILARAADHLALLRRLQWAGFTVGLGGALVYAYAIKQGTGMETVGLALAVDMVTAPLLTAAYAATVLRLLSGARGERISGALAPAGRMALTNYLSQSLVMALLFTGYGLGLVGRVAPFLVTVVGLTLFAVQLVLSRWWMSGHAYGPVEWVLRAVTNARRPRWRSRRERASG